MGKILERGTQVEKNSQKNQSEIAKIDKNMENVFKNVIKSEL